MRLGRRLNCNDSNNTNPASASGHLLTGQLDADQLESVGLSKQQHNRHWRRAFPREAFNSVDSLGSRLATEEFSTVCVTQCHFKDIAS